jgi:hypothetical protein
MCLFEIRKNRAQIRGIITKKQTTATARDMCWAEWEGRLEDVEREIRRGEVVRKGREEA